MLITGGPFVKPVLQVIEVVAASFLKVGKVDGVVDVSQGVKVAKANLHWIPARKFIAHRIIALSFLPHALHYLNSTRRGFLKTIVLWLYSPPQPPNT